MLWQILESHREAPGASFYVLLDQKFNKSQKIFKKISNLPESRREAPDVSFCVSTDQKFNKY